MNGGTSAEGVATKIGDNGFFMTGVHVAHDCRIGDNVVMANNATLAGHVAVGDFAIFGGLSAALQFTRIGQHAMIGGLTGVERDVIPYGSVTGDRARLVGLNIIGLQRRGFSREDIQALRIAYQMLFVEDTGTLADRVNEVAARFSDVRPVLDIVDFIREARGIVQAKAVKKGSAWMRSMSGRRTLSGT